MADREGLVIHEPPSPTHLHRPDVERDPPPPPCVGCRGWHGGVGAEIGCLRASLLAERAWRTAEKRTADREILRLLECLKEFEPKEAK